MTFVQYTAPPGLVAISYSNYCNDSLCNNRNNLASILQAPEPTGTWDMGVSTKVLVCLLCASAQPKLPVGQTRVLFRVVVTEAPPRLTLKL